MRILGRIVGVQRTEQSVGIIVGAYLTPESVIGNCSYVVEQSRLAGADFFEE